MKITEGYAKLVGADAFFWAWPLAGVYNRRLACVANTEIAHAGPVPSAPLNRLAMLTDYVAPEERIVACPNQDVVYGGGSLALEQSPVVMQVPDFGDRFWVYQVTDTRTDSFVQLGSMYATTPGFYLLVGPDWIGDVLRRWRKIPISGSRAAPTSRVPTLTRYHQPAWPFRLRPPLQPHFRWRGLHRSTRSHRTQAQKWCPHTTRQKSQTIPPPTAPPAHPHNKRRSALGKPASRRPTRLSRRHTRRRSCPPLHW
jgi:hypothetical protein